MIPRVLTIAGSDSSGGAGIQADVKTIAALGGHAMCAVTAVTAQNTLGVEAVEVMPPRFVRQQIAAVAGDIEVDATKTGMLATALIIDEVAAAVAELELGPLVVDPVLVAESGAILLEPRAQAALMEKMIPLAAVVTPNAVEAARLLASEVTDLAGQRRAARALVEAGAGAAVVKGGHLPGAEAIDVLCAGGETHELRSPRLRRDDTHGTGCIFAAAIAFHLAAGRPVADSVERAKTFVASAIEHGLDIGVGAGPANPSARPKPS